MTDANKLPSVVCAVQGVGLHRHRVAVVYLVYTDSCSCAIPGHDAPVGKKVTANARQAGGAVCKLDTSFEPV